MTGMEAVCEINILSHQTDTRAEALILTHR